MDRQLVYAGAIPLETDVLNSNKFAMVGLSKLTAAVLGTSIAVNGFTCIPTATASLQVQLTAGEIYSIQNIDSTAYSSLAADTAHQVVKQGILLDTVLLTTSAPATSGQSINWLVQVIYQDSDLLPVVLPYYNASNPSVAYSGPANAGTTNNTVRKGVATVSIKTGTAATTGSQTTPAPDSGYTGLFVVTVANAQTTITSTSISTLSGAPFIIENLTQKIGQSGSQISALAGGAADALTASFTPALTVVANQTVLVRAALANATTTPTITINGLTALTLVKGNNLPLIAGDIAGAGHWLELTLDSTLSKAVLQNPANGVVVNGQIGYKNKFIGGDFTINPWQRGTSFAAAASASYTADRWGYIKVGSAVHTIAKIADAPTITQAGLFTQSCLALNVTTAQTTFAAGDNILLYQNIEGLNAVSFGFGQTSTKSVTLSFWVKGAKTGIHCVSLSNGAATRSYIAEYTIIALNTWEYKTIVIAVDNAGTWTYDNTTGLSVRFALAAGTTSQSTANSWQAGNFYTTVNQVNELDTVGNNFKIALIQLEGGTVATTFEARSFLQEFILCQRYYEIGNIRIDAYGLASGLIGSSYSYKSNKRSTPTIIYSSTGYSNASGIATDPSSNVNSFEATAIITTTGSGAFSTVFTSSSEL